MKRFIFASIILVLAIIATAFTLPYFISGDAVRAQLIQRAKQITGRDMQFSGTPKVSLNPFLGIEINDVVFPDQFNGEGSKPILQMPKLKGRLSIAAALRGEVKFSEIQFVRPVFNLKIYSTGQSSWHFPEGKVWSALAEAQNLISEKKAGDPIDTSTLTKLNIGSFSIFDGIVEYENEINGSLEKFTSLNASFNWKNTAAPWSFNGSSIWRGDLMQFDVGTTKPLLLMAGGASELTVQIISEPLIFDFDGKANNLSNLFFDGNITASSPSLRRLLNFMGNDLDADSSLGQFGIDGNLSGTMSQIKVEEAQVSLDGNESIGNISYIYSDTGTSRLSGTLAFSNFDLAPYLGDISMTPKGGNSGMGGAGLATLNQLSSFEMDLRISSKTVSCNLFTLTNFAGGIITKNGSMTIDIGSADYADGNVVGSIVAGVVEDKLSLATKLNFTDINGAKLLPPNMSSTISLTGTGNIEIRLRSAGESKSELTRNLTGETTFELKDGLLVGIDLLTIKNSNSTDPQDQEEPVIPAIGKNAAPTKFSSLLIKTMINRGVGWLSDSTIESDEIKTVLIGKLDLHLGTLALRGRFLENDVYVGNYFIGGTLQQPLWVSQNFDHPELITPQIVPLITPNNTPQITPQMGPQIAPSFLPSTQPTTEFEYDGFSK